MNCDDADTSCFWDKYIDIYRLSIEQLIYTHFFRDTMSSFFDNTKTVGIAFLIVGIILIVSAIFSIAMGFIEVDAETKGDVKDWTLYCVIGGIGSLICAALYTMFALKVFNGSMTAKIEILASYVRIVGLTVALGGIFDGVASIVGGQDAAAALAGAIMAVVIGLIIMFIASKINDGKETVGDSIIWIILLIAFVILLVISVLEIITIIGIIDGVAHLIIALFMIAFLFDADVKKKMNM